MLVDRKSGSAGMPRPISYAVFCLKKKKPSTQWEIAFRQLLPKQHHLCCRSAYCRPYLATFSDPYYLFASFPSAFFFLMLPPPPRSTLFPYTTLFRSAGSHFCYSSFFGTCFTDT